MRSDMSTHHNERQARQRLVTPLVPTLPALHTSSPPPLLLPLSSGGRRAMRIGIRTDRNCHPFDAACAEIMDNLRGHATFFRRLRLIKNLLDGNCLRGVPWPLQSHALSFRNAQHRQSARIGDRHDRQTDQPAHRVVGNNAGFCWTAVDTMADVAVKCNNSRRDVPPEHHDRFRQFGMEDSAKSGKSAPAL